MERKMGDTDPSLIGQYKIAMFSHWVVEDCKKLRSSSSSPIHFFFIWSVFWKAH